MTDSSAERPSAEPARTIAVVDQTLRDAHQCLWATRMTTAHMLPIAPLMDRIGFARIEVIAAIQFGFSRKIRGSACGSCTSASGARR